MLDPLHGDGYQFWSGIGGNLFPLWIGLMIYLAPSRCQEIGCRHKAIKRHPMHGYPVCKRHVDT